MKYMLLFVGLLFCVEAETGFFFPNEDEEVQSDALVGDCMLPTECPALKQILETNPNGLEEFDTCGALDGQPLYQCPSLTKPDDEDCDCKTLQECEFLMTLASERKFREIESHKKCGYTETIWPKYCCPSKFRKKAKTSPADIMGIKRRINADVTNSTNMIPKQDQETEESETEKGEEDDCGFLSDIRIFGGSDALDHEFPWAVSLVYVDADTGSRQFLCGGTLVSSRFVLTAAHCINSKGNHHLAEVQLGHSNLSHPDSFAVEIEAVTVHPDFTSVPQLINDLALLKLSEAVRTSEKARPICLPDDQTDDEIIEPVVVGWGLVNHVNSSEILQRLDVNITDIDDCEVIYQSRVPGFLIEDFQICATGLPGTDSCKGDSGGPLMFLDNHNRFKIVGVTSFGTIKCDSSIPGVYSRVSSFVEWIKSVIN